MFNPGFVVKLKSGGPAMTVVQAEAEKDIVCVWFDANQVLQKGTFNLPTLRREAVKAAPKQFREAA